MGLNKAIDVFGDIGSTKFPVFGFSVQPTVLKEFQDFLNQFISFGFLDGFQFIVHL